MPEKNKFTRREIGKPIKNVEKPRCFGQEYLKYPEVCGLSCIYGFSGLKTCDRSPEPVF